MREYCLDNLANKSGIEEIVRYTNIFSFFNFDMLSACVEEMNRYDEPLDEVLRCLNIEPEMRETDSYTVSAMMGAVEVVMNESYHNFQIENFSYHIYLYEIAKKATDEQKNIFKAVGFVGRAQQGSMGRRRHPHHLRHQESGGVRPQQ